MGKLPPEQRKLSPENGSRSPGRNDRAEKKKKKNVLELLAGGIVPLLRGEELLQLLGWVDLPAAIAKVDAGRGANN